MKNEDFKKDLSLIIKELSSENIELNIRNLNLEFSNLSELFDMAFVVKLIRKLILPSGFSYNSSESERAYLIGADLNALFEKIAKYIELAYIIALPDIEADSANNKRLSKILASEFVGSLPRIKKTVEKDLIGFYKNDPAAKSYAELIIAYPGLKAIISYRAARELYLKEIPLLPRLLSEYAHMETGVEIHPGADIGDNIFIDHGSGIVIGETSVIGNNVKIYQGVTLGAKDIALDEFGRPLKTFPRHPIIEDDVTIYPNSTLIGRIRVGKGAIIGGNMWIAEDVPPMAVLIKK
jgi:serine O-acetyltransferase